MTRILAALVLLLLAARRRAGARRATRTALRPPRHGDAEGHRRRRGRRRGQGHLRQPRARRRRRRGAVRRRQAALDRHAGLARSAPAARSSPRCPARRWTACARSRSFRDGRIVAAGHAAPGRRHDALRRAAGCCRRARSTRASAPASATCWPARPARELGAMVDGPQRQRDPRRLAPRRRSPIVIRLLRRRQRRTRRSAPAATSTAPRSGSAGRATGLLVRRRRAR